MEEQVRVTDLGSGPFVEIRWISSDDAGTGMMFSARSALQDDGSPSFRLVGQDSFREIEISGQPASSSGEAGIATAANGPGRRMTLAGDERR